MFKIISAAALAVTMLASSVSAATLSGTFSINIYQRLNATTAQSGATAANLAGATFLDSIVYNGALDFGTYAGSSTTIGQWLATGLGAVTGLDAGVASKQLSKGNIGDGTATTTFFDIVATFASGFNSIIRHDDGITAYDDGVVYASSAAPTTVIDTAANGFNGGTWRLIYAATNSDPSVLRVTGDRLPAPVPLPAGLPLLLAGVAALAVLRRRAKA